MFISFVRKEKSSFQRIFSELNKFCKWKRVYAQNKLKTLTRVFFALFSSNSLSAAYLYRKELKADLVELHRKENFYSIFCYCSSMAPYVLEDGAGGNRSLSLSRRIIDFVDIDSFKWGEMATNLPWPLRWIYALEKKRLAKLEAKIAKKFFASFLTTERERERLLELAPEITDKVFVLSQGAEVLEKEKVSAQKPKEREKLAVVFIGEMSYFPNEDGVINFYRNILPRLRKQLQSRELDFYIVGRNPSKKLIKTCKNAVITGEVASVDEYLEIADVFVAPLRLAFGVQVKVLQAMAFSIPVVVSKEVAGGLSAKNEEEMLVAANNEEFTSCVYSLLVDRQKREEISQNARQYLIREHNWNKKLFCPRQSLLR